MPVKRLALRLKISNTGGTARDIGSYLNLRYPGSKYKNPEISKLGKNSTENYRSPLG